MLEPTGVSRVVVCVDDEESGLYTISSRTTAVDPCPSPLVEHDAVECRESLDFRHVVRRPSPVSLEDTYDGVALGVAEPEVSLCVECQSCGTDILSSRLVSG